jgi:hypothetical protein
MSDLIGCLVKLGVLVGLLILLWNFIVLGFFYWLITELAGIESGFSWREFGFFVLGMIVLLGIFKKR